MSVWLVTGANSGIGLALVKYLLDKGCKVIATARDLAKLPPEVGTAKGITLDLNWPDDRIKAAVSEAWDAFGHIDVVVNNAANGLVGPTEILRAEDLRAQFQANFFGQISVIQALIPPMRKRGSGIFFNISSIAPWDNFPPMGAYNASKAAIDAMTETLAKEIAPFGLRAYIVAPGFFPTSWFTTAQTTENQAFREHYPQFDGFLEKIFAQQMRSGNVGNVEKVAARLYEIAVEKPRALRDTWVRIPLGVDCGEKMLAKLELIRENVEGTREIWSSTNLTPEEVKARFGDF